MFKRLGNVLYWIGCILAGIAVLVGVAFLFMPGETLFFVFAPPFISEVFLCVQTYVY